jgi:hypothetical protein
VVARKRGDTLSAAADACGAETARLRPGRALNEQLLLWAPRSGGQADTALGTPCLYDLAAVTGGAAGTEPMGAGTLEAARLEGLFHNSIPRQAGVRSGAGGSRGTWEKDPEVYADMRVGSMAIGFSVSQSRSQAGLWITGRHRARLHGLSASACVHARPRDLASSASRGQRRRFSQRGRRIKWFRSGTSVRCC